MAEVATAFVTLVPSFKGGAGAIQRELDGPAERAGRSAGKRTRKGFTSSFGGGGSLIPTAAIAAGVAGFGVLAKGAIDAAGEAEQSIGATSSIFGRYANQIIANSKRAATQYGLDANAYRESANLIASQLKNQGVSSDQLAGKTDALIAKGADLASMFGGTTQEAVAALSSAFKGETDPIERYGISLSATKVNAELAARGQDKLKGKAADLAKQAVITDLIMKQSKDSTGNFARESDTLAGKQQRLGAQFKNVQTTVGTMLLPAMSGLLDNVTDMLPKVEGFIKEMQTGEGAGGKFANAARSVGNALKVAAEWMGKAWDFAVKYQDILVPLAAAIGAGALAVKALSAAAKAYTAVQTALNFVLTANPIGLVIIAVAALAAGLVVAYKKSETFRDLVNKAFDLVKVGAFTLAREAVGAFRHLVNFYLSMVSTLINGAAKAFGWVPGLGPKLKAAAKKVDEFKTDANNALAKVENDLDVKVKTAEAEKKLNDFRRRQSKAIDVFVNVQTRSAGRVTIAGQSVNIGMREHGGPVSAGSPYIVGEKRPELFVPKTDGYIVPRVPEGFGGSGKSIEQTNHFYGITDAEEAAAASVNRLTFATRMP